MWSISWKRFVCFHIKEVLSFFSFLCNLWFPWECSWQNSLFVWFLLCSDMKYYVIHTLTFFSICSSWMHFRFSYLNCISVFLLSCWLTSVSIKYSFFMGETISRLLFLQHSTKITCFSFNSCCHLTRLISFFFFPFPNSFPSLFSCKLGHMIYKFQKFLGVPIIQVTCFLSLSFQSLLT